MRRKRRRIQGVSMRRARGAGRDAETFSISSAARRAHDLFCVGHFDCPPGPDWGGVRNSVGDSTGMVLAMLPGLYDVGWYSDEAEFPSCGLAAAAVTSVV